MDNDEQFDLPKQNRLNKTNNEDDVIVIRREELQPLYDLDCKHEGMKKDPSDKIGDTVAWVCPDCHRGVFLPKNIVLT